MHKRGKLAARPQNRNTDSVAPSVEIRMTVVTWNLSIKVPKMIAPKTDVVLNKATVSVPDIDDNPNIRA